MIQSIIITFLLLLMLFTPKHARSHPHGWIETSVDFIMKGNKITAIQAKWSFDEFTSMFLVESTGAGFDKKLDPIKLIEIEEQILEIIKKSNYFSNIYIDKKKYPTEKIEFPNASANNDIINFSFVIPLVTPVDPIKNKLAVSFYDNSYYYDVYFAEKNPVNFINDTNNKCGYKIEEDLENTYYFKMVNPEIMRVKCGE